VLPAELGTPPWWSDVDGDETVAVGSDRKGGGELPVCGLAAAGMAEWRKKEQDTPAACDWTGLLR
jgi:hypothetical protein